MIFEALALPGAFAIDLEPRGDERGFFARVFCQKEFAAHGLATEMVQANVSQNVSKGTLRGMHYQRAPFAEVKLVRCIHGTIHDVIIDLRPDSPTYLNWLGVELSRRNRRALYVPEGFAHGYQALEDDTEVLYLVSQFYTPSHESAIRWNDPRFGIRWPLPDPILSPKDAAHPDFRP
ncbi:MAG TPA: dTDP-4-dehydrorhamnose 3,5-epimerase [Candidatus Sulfotelmatobacter sp.]|nr:dTDP-4-dehydrorhamnose 3,5-epimerase [Candidatus Sulfotelmatobacter sp.]